MSDPKLEPRRPAILAIALLAALPGLAPEAPAQNARDSREVLAAFGQVAAAARDATVRIECDGRRRAQGVIVGADGLVLTKASEMSGRIVCELVDGRELDARLLATDPEHDLALLGIEAGELVPIAWSEDERYEVGRLVITPGIGRLPLAVGVIGVGPRRIPGGGGYLGVYLARSTSDPLVDSVIENTGAATAGLQRSDLITRVDGEPVDSQASLIDAIRDRRVGSQIEVTFVRAGRVQRAVAVLGRRPPEDEPDRLSGPLSTQRDGFPIAFEHDSVLLPRECGGVMVGLDGRAIGLNIARSGRATSYAIPARDVQHALRRLERQAAQSQPTGAEDKPRQGRAL